MEKVWRIDGDGGTCDLVPVGVLVWAVFLVYAYGDSCDITKGVNIYNPWASEAH